MYLFVFLDGTARAVNENLSVADLMGVRQGTLKVFRCPDGTFEQLFVEDDQLKWTETSPAKVVIRESWRFHL